MAAKTSKPRPSKKAGSNGKPLPSAGEILTLSEAAAFLRVSEDGLKADALIGKIPGRLVAGEWRFSRIALLVWLSEPETKTIENELCGQALVEHIRKIGLQWNIASEREAEAFIAATKSSSSGG